MDFYWIDISPSPIEQQLKWNHTLSSYNFCYKQRVIKIEFLVLLFN
jgi:hypothetical protein